MAEIFAVPISEPPASVALDSSALSVRFEVRAVLWGNRRRYEVVDTRTDTTLVVRATSRGADDDVMVLNMGARGGPQVFDATRVEPPTA